nr:putative ribonuclease H-like domain-containing protein [Tanacetum cinerariifolium]
NGIAERKNMTLIEATRTMLADSLLPIPFWAETVNTARYRDLSIEFKDCSDNSSNEVNAAGSIIPTIGQNSLNSTNTFSVPGPSNASASPTYGKSSFIDASQLPDDPDMPELEDITHSDDEDDVG